MNKNDLYSYVSSFSEITGVAEKDALDYAHTWGISALVENAYPVLKTSEQAKKYEDFKNILSLNNKITRKEKVCLSTPRKSRNYLASLTNGEWQKERFIVVFLDSKLEVTGHQIVSIGGINQSLVHPREVFKNAIVHGAVSILVGHNHPSGHCKPSPEDDSVTKRLAEVGELVGIRLVDHIIFEEFNDNLYSYRESSFLLY